MEIQLVYCLLVLILVRCGEFQSTPGQVIGPIVGETYEPDLSTVTPNSFSLTFVFDATGSMSDDLAQVKAGARQVLQSTRLRSGASLYNYVLVPFNDPNVGPTTVTTDPTVFTRAIDALRVDGGGDCPEMSVTAIREALLVSLPNSYIYVFADASAKDYGLLADVLELIRQRQSQVVFLLTGHCSDTDQDSYKVYEKIAATSSGQVFVISKSDVSTVVGYIEESVEGDKTSLISSDLEEGGHNQWYILVDPELQEFSVSLSGPGGNISLIGPDGVLVTNTTVITTLLDLENVKIIRVLRPRPGRWTLNTNSTGPHSLRVTGPSSLDFQIRFSKEPTLNWAEAEIQPLEGFPSHILINVSGLEQPGVVTNLRIEDRDGTIIQEVDLFTSGDPNQPYLYTSQAINTPRYSFHVTIVGTTMDGYRFERTSKTSIVQAPLVLPLFNRAPNPAAYISDWHQYQYQSYNNRMITNGGNGMYLNGNQVFVYKNENQTIAAVYNKTYSFPDYNFRTIASHPFLGLLLIKNPEEERVNFTLQVTGSVSSFRRGAITRSSNNLTVNNIQAQYHVVQISGTRNPSICEVYFTFSNSEDWNSVASDAFRMVRVTNSLPSLDNSVEITGRPRNVVMGYMLLSKKSGRFVSEDEIEAYLRSVAMTLQGLNLCLEQNGGCQHNCSFNSDVVTCSCQSGYELLENGFDCRWITVSKALLNNALDVYENASYVIPLFYSYRYDGGTNYISDGGRDMFDGGNKVRIFNGSERLANPFPYGSLDHFSNYNFAISPSGSHPFLSLVWISNSTEQEQNYSIQVDGYTGTNRRGNLSIINDGFISLDDGRIHYRVFQVYGAGDPSICEVYFTVLRDDWQSTGLRSMTLQSGDSTHFINNTATISGRLSNVLFGYALLSGSTGQSISRNNIEEFLRNYGSQLGTVNISINEIASTGYLSNWENWSDCSATCDPGVRVRVRTCSNDDCVGDLEEYIPCQVVKCPGVWSDYGTWSECSATCGTGSRVRVRTCSNNNCAGDPQERDYCATHICPIILSNIFLNEALDLFENISSVIPAFYSYRYDGVLNNIGDGGFDMYDTGNLVRIYKGSAVPSLSNRYGSEESFSDYNFAISPARSHPFMSMVWISNTSDLDQSYSIQVHGNLGADGGGNISKINDGYISLDGFRIYYRVFQVYGTSDPSVCEVYFTIQNDDWHSSGLRTMVLNSGTSTDVVRNTATINGRVQNTLFGYALLSRYVVTSRLRGQEVRRNSIEEFLRRYARHLNTVSLSTEIPSTENVCGNRTWFLSVGVESSISFPGFPDIRGFNHLNCWYTFTSQNDTRIRFWFDDLSVNNHDGDFHLWLYNGEINSTDQLLRINQPSQVGQMFHSESNVMSINLRVPRNYSYTGLQLRATAIAACGSSLGAVTNPLQLVSPGFPLRHLPNQICTWSITAAPDHVIEITANQISDETCCDHVQIAETGESLRQGEIYLSDENHLKINFIANNSVARNPFSISYRAVHLCGEMPQLTETNRAVRFHAPSFSPSKSGQYICTYSIEAPEDSRIRFWFDSFGTQRFNSDYFYLKFFDGLVEDINQFLVLDKENQTRTLFHSKSNRMVIQNSIYKPYNYTGFIINYEAADSSFCGSCFSAMDYPQTLTSPDYPLMHSPNYVCTWNIEVPTGFIVELVMDHLSNETCCIYVEAVEMVPYRIATRLNTTQAYYSIGDQVTINFVANHSLERNGFQLSYRKAPCGQHLLATANPQTLTSPNYPLMHPTNQRCFWNITSLSDFVIEVTLHNITNETCCSTLQMNLPDPSHTIQLTSPQQTVTSPGPSAQIHFFASNSNQRSGFSLTYKAVSICGKSSFQAESDVYKILNPPGYPLNKYNSMPCQYTITADQGKTIRFWVLDFGSNDVGSDSYYLQFFDKSNYGSSFLTLNSTNQIGVMHHSLSNQLTIQSTAERSYDYDGFRIQYIAVDTCGVELAATEEFRYLTTSNYPDSYSGELICTWTISTFNNYMVEVVAEFDHDLESCCESLEVIRPTVRPLHSLESYTSPRNYLTLQFISSNSTLRLGAYVSYRRVHICGQQTYEAELNRTNRISGSGIPRGYSNNFECTYTISAPCGTRIQFWITSLGIDRYRGSDYFQMLFYNKINTNASSFLQISRPNQIGSIFYSKENEMSFKTMARNGYTYNGFEMSYQAIESCGGVLDAIETNQELVEASNPADKFCNWTVTAPVNHRIILSSIRAFTPALRNRSSPHENQLFIIEADGGKLHLDTDNYFSQSNSLSIAIISNFSNGNNGFSAFYRAVNICGRSRLSAAIQSDDQYFSSPSFPFTDRDVLECQYTISSPVDSRIRFYFSSFGIDPGSSTRFQIQLYNGPSSESESFQTINSASYLNNIYLSRDNIMTLTLQVHSGDYDGFQLYYRAVSIERDIYFHVRVNFTATYVVIGNREMKEKFLLDEYDTVDVSNNVFEQIRNDSKIAPHFVEEDTARSFDLDMLGDSRILVRTDLKWTFALLLDNSTIRRFGLKRDRVNDITMMLFSEINENSNSSQLVSISNQVPRVDSTTVIVPVRVDFKRNYRVLLPRSTLDYYGLLETRVNEVTNKLFDQLLNNVTYAQLNGFDLTVPFVHDTQLKVEVNKSRVYLLDLPTSVAVYYNLSTTNTTRISNSIFNELREIAGGVQLQEVVDILSSGTMISFRSNFIRSYTTNLPEQAVEELGLVINSTNDVTAEMLQRIIQQYGVHLQLNNIETVEPSGDLITVRVNRTRVYNMYMPPMAVSEFDLLNSTINDVSNEVFMLIVNQCYYYQLTEKIEPAPISGVKVQIRVGLKVYDVYVSEQTKLKYRLHLKRINDVSKSVFDLIKNEADFVQFVEIRPPVITLNTPTHVRVKYKFIYDVTLPDSVKDEYNLQSNVTNDVSEAIFTRIQHYADNIKLLQVLTKDITTKNKFTIRVDSNNMYEVILNDSDARKFPLAVGEINDVTTELYNEIRNHAVAIQLVSLRSNPVTVTTRVGLKWVYQLVIPDAVRVKFNLELNKTNDVSNSIFTSLREQASSLQLISDEPQDIGNKTSVDIRVNSSLTYTIFVDPIMVRELNLTTSKVNQVSISTFTNLAHSNVTMQLIQAQIKDESAICPSNNWTRWFNRDDPSGPCDCETLPELRREYPGLICEKPTTFEARLENCRISYDPTLSNIVANLVVGFRCNNEPGRTCLDYEVRFCCP